MKGPPLLNDSRLFSTDSGISASVWNNIHFSLAFLINDEIIAFLERRVDGDSHVQAL
jgi:hypothetical protein